MNPAQHRAQLVGMLAEAAEIEHCLMCTYLYAAFSLKERADEGLQPAELEAVRRWRREIVAIATDEMLHLALANNLAIAIGARPHYQRFNFPIAPGLFPADVTVALAPFDRATLDHFVYLERPGDVAERDGVVDPKPSYRRHAVAGRLMPAMDDYATVGELYETIAESCTAIAERLGEARLFLGPRGAQLGSREFRLPGLATIGSVAEARQAIELIRHQGEGSRDETAGSHYARFRAIRDEWAALAAARPGFTPARPAARDPVMRDPVVADRRVHITAEPAASLLDAGNVCYELMLRLLAALTEVAPGTADADVNAGAGVAARRSAICEQTVALMHTIADIGSRLTELPANDAQPGTTAGLTFAASRVALGYLSGETATRLLGERFAGLAERLATLADGDARLADLRRHAETVARCGAHWIADHDQRFGAVGGDGPGASASGSSATVAAAKPVAAVSANRAASAANFGTPASGGAAKPPDIAASDTVRLSFDTVRCIHARMCVLGEPAVFLANTPGVWLHPEAATAERIAIVAAQCPSGAITYARLDGGPNEAAPRVNVLRVRENGPLAFTAAMQINGLRETHGADATPYRATLCRCGASKNKPFCDGSHQEAAFVASGEPQTQPSEPLAVRDGPLGITPTKNGPLKIEGNLELCSGTGRTFDRVTDAYLCRCGQSQAKPLCDGSHARAGFEAAGV